MNLKLWTLSALAVLSLTACKGNFEPAEDEAVATSGVDVEFSGGRRLSISGRMFGKTGTGNEARVPMGGVSLLAIVNGVNYKVVSGDNGGFAIRDVPMRPNRDGNDTDDISTIVIYVDKLGWTFDGDGVTAGNQNWVTVKVDASERDANGNYHVDLGPLLMQQDVLKVTSSLVKSESMTDRWWPSNSVVGALPAERGQVYMRATDTSLTLEFNMPMDPTYNINFAELFKTDGTTQTFTGTWDTTGTIYTITPTATLTPDNHDNRQYQLRISRPVRAFNSWTGTRHELEAVSFQFDVLKASRDTLLAASAPSTNAAGEDVVGYYVDAARVLQTGYLSGVLAVDVTNAAATSYCIKFNQNANARATNGYRIYARNQDVQNGLWFDSTSFWTLQLQGDGTVSACTANIFDNTFTGDGRLSYSEKIQLIATPVDNDGNEGPISGVAFPLTISDNWQPSLVSGGYSKTVTPNEADNYLSSTPSGMISMTFSETLDPYSSMTSASLTPASGMLNGVTAPTGFRVTNGLWTAGKAQVNLAFKVHTSTLARSAKNGDTVLYLSNLNGLKVGYKVVIYDAASGVTSGSKTISNIRTAENAITISAALGAAVNFPAGATVQLLEGPSGLTYFTANTTAAVFASTRVVPVDSGTRFFAGQTVNFHYIDEEGTQTVGPFTVESSATSSLTLTSGVTAAVPAGALVAESSVTLAEPVPRSASATDFTPTNPLQWNGGIATTTLAVDNWDTGDDAQPTVLLLASSTGIGVNDFVKIAGSTSTTTLTTKAVAGDTTLTVAAHTLKKNDRIRIEPPSVRVAITTAIASGATTATIATATPFVSGETNVMITDPAFETTVAAATAAGATSFTMAATDGIAIGQSIVVDSGVEAAETLTVANVVGLVVTTNAATNAHALGARVTRAALGPTAHTIGADSAATTVTISAAAANYSKTAYITKTRGHVEVVLTSAPGSTTSITLPAAIAASNWFPATVTNVRLVSSDEWRRVTAVNGNLITLSSGISFAHRSGAAVTKPTQFSMQAAAASMADFVIGDTVVCDSLPAATDAHNDRFEGTVVDFDTIAGLATFTTTKTALVLNDSDLKCRHMGDAVKIQGVLDINGQALRTTWGNKMSLQTTSVVR